MKDSPAVSFSSSDFLSKSQQKKGTKRKAETVKTKKTPVATPKKPVAKKAKKSIVSDATRGHMILFCKSKASVAAELKQKEEKSKAANTKVSEPTAAMTTLSITVSSGDTLLVLDGDVVKSRLLTEEENNQIKSKQTFAKKKYGEEPTIYKLQWRDRDGASLLGLFVSKKTTFNLTSKFTETQSFTVKESVWLASKESIGNISLADINGKTDILALVPDYKGVVRLSLDEHVNGTFGLEMLPQ